MKIEVKVRTRSRREQVIGPLEDGSYKVEVKSPPVDGEANKAVCDLLAKFFNKPKYAVRVLLGGTSSKKLIEIDD